MRSFILRVSLVFASVFLTLLACEVGLRIKFHLQARDIRVYQASGAYNDTLSDYRRFISHPFLPYAPRPYDSRMIAVYRPETDRVYETRYSLNSLGFRTPQRPFEKPAGVKRIVTLGGSTTFDGFTDAETWPARLEARLRARGFNVEVINLGVDMAASPTSLIDLEFIGLQYRPDLVISYDGVNDTVLVGRDILPDYRNVYGHFDDQRRTIQASLPRWLLRSYLITWLTFRFDRGSADIGSQVMKVSAAPETPDPLQSIGLFERNLKLIRAASREYGASFIAATVHFARPDSKVTAFNQSLRAFYAQEQISYIDLEKALPPGQLLHVDQVHWTRDGIEQVAGEMEKKVLLDMKW
jgi:hypothetical protein